MQRRSRTNERQCDHEDGFLPSRFQKRKSSGSSLTTMLVIFTFAIVLMTLTIMHLPNERNHRPKETAIHTGLNEPKKQRIMSGVKKNAGSANSTTNEGEQEYHLIFSTGCSLFQDWQSYVFFYHALKSGQQGRVTRIASGCNENDAKVLTNLHREQIEIMSDRFHLHLTPDYSTVKPGLKFKYFNKPFGVRHWIENVLGFPKNPENEDAIVILLDPDQIVLRPFTNDFTGSTESWRPTPDSGVPMRYKVEHGVPFAQQYGYGLQWKTKVNVTNVAGGKPSRIHTMNMEEAKGHYAVGPPYLATAKDMYSIVETWTEFVPRVYDDYPHLLAEMFAYSLAAAHLNLPHHIAHGFMVSDTRGSGEGWNIIDSMPKTQVCDNRPNKDVPHVLHYCQKYMLGNFFFSKYRLRKDFLSCGAALLMEPTSSIVYESHQITPDGIRKEPVNEKIAKRNAFVLCTLFPALNEASKFYKDHHCDGKAIYAKKYTLV